MNTKNEDNIEILKEHIEELYLRISMLSQYNANTYNANLGQFDGYSVHFESCTLSQWNIYTSSSVNSHADISVYVATGGYNQYRQVPATITINGNHIMIDLDFPCTGYVVYKETETGSSPSLTCPTSFANDIVTLNTDENYAQAVTDFQMNDVSLVSDPTDPNTTIKKQPF